MSKRFKMPSPVFSADDKAYFEELMKIEIDDGSVDIVAQDAPCFDPADEGSMSEFVDAMADLTQECAEGELGEMILLIRGNFDDPRVQKFFLDQMTYEDSYFWRIARGRQDLNRLEAGDFELPEGTA